jgi:hypothetical protein
MYFLNKKRLNSKFLLILSIIFLGSTLMCYILYSQCLKSSISYYQIVQEYKSDRKIVHSEQFENESDDNNKYILLWTTFFNSENWELGQDVLGKEVNLNYWKYFLKSIENSLRYTL